MSERLSCYRCGHSLAGLPIPLSRRDECPGCTAELHVCRMCFMYDPREPSGCREEDALEVADKERANFCDYFKPDPDAFTPGMMETQHRAESELASLFGEDSAAGGRKESESGKAAAAETLRRAEDLFKP